MSFCATSLCDGVQDDATFIEQLPEDFVSSRSGVENSMGHTVGDKWLSLMGRVITAGTVAARAVLVTLPHGRK